MEEKLKLKTVLLAVTMKAVLPIQKELLTSVIVLLAVMALAMDVLQVEYSVMAVL